METKSIINPRAVRKIKKIAVSSGIYWVEIPEADLYILCGCPEDSVKHLVKRGLITSTGRDGVAFESGPNAILLSDVLLQNGRFANLAEFPVMQMLYRQGMILPNHPNNTGVKPLLMGLAGQVNAQLQYVYRGNYGLISKQELMDVGISAERAEEMMFLKLFFANGKIHHSKQFLDTLVIENERVEIKNGVFIRRLRLNEFDIEYQDESVSVDLNLSPSEHYESAYPLGMYQLQREYFSVVHIGEGNGWDANQPCMASILIYQGKIYLLDAGPNILFILKAIGISVGEIEGIFHTHSHDDHFAGIASLLRAEHKIKYYATALVQASVSKKLAALLSADEEYFRDFFEVCTVDFDVWNDLDGLEVKPLFSPHPVETNIFIFRTLSANGYRSYAHWADIASFTVLDDMIQKSGPLRNRLSGWLETIKKDYRHPVDIKKIDVNGGLIHGDAEDFRGDTSEKIILSHIEADLSINQKTVGSKTNFGMVDVLIPGYFDFARRQAYDYLRSYFPDVSRHEFRCLLNNELITFTPGSIILDTQHEKTTLFLILSGNVEAVNTHSGSVSHLLAGGMVGNLPEIFVQAATITYRATSFVQALPLPISLILEFINKHKISEQFDELAERRDFLQKTSLFGNSLSFPVQNEIALALELRHYSAGQVISAKNLTVLNLVKIGRLERYMGEDIYGTLGVHDFFGEEMSVFDTPSIFGIRTIEPTDVYQISGKFLREIPIVYWKLIEDFEKRKRLVLNTELTSVSLFEWRDEYRVSVEVIDCQNKSLFALGIKVLKAIRSGADIIVIQNLITQLVETAEGFFQDEEALLDRYGYPEVDMHRKKHKLILVRIVDLQQELINTGLCDHIGFEGIFEEWLVDHVFSEDRKYGKFLNSKGVF